MATMTHKPITYEMATMTDPSLSGTMATMGDVPKPAKVTPHTVCWICEKPKTPSKRQLCTECYLVHLQHDHHTYSTWLGGKRFRVQGCRKCRMIGRKKSGLPSVCIPGKKRVVPTHWTCSTCSAPFASSAACVAHFMRCGYAPRRPVLAIEAPRRPVLAIEAPRADTKDGKKKTLAFGPEVKDHDHAPMGSTFFLYFLQAWRKGLVKEKGVKEVVVMALEEIKQEAMTPALLTALKTTLAKWKEVIARKQRVTLVFQKKHTWHVEARHLERLEVLMASIR